MDKKIKTSQKGDLLLSLSVILLILPRYFPLILPNLFKFLLDHLINLPHKLLSRLVCELLIPQRNLIQ